MDHRRNELVATDLMVTIVSCGFGFCAVVVGVFGERFQTPVPFGTQRFFASFPCFHVVFFMLPQA